MSRFSLNIAVAFMVFKRLDTTKQVFEEIRNAKPPRLYIVCDAARKSVPGEEEKVRAVREYIEQNIDWDCEVYKNYAEENMGCRDRIVSGINWCFEQEDELIILEDDCRPHPSFFEFCQCMLEHYRNDSRIMHIGGNNPLGILDNGKGYLLSQRPTIWGWATWKRAWDLYDVNMETWPQVKAKKELEYRFVQSEAYETHAANWDSVYTKKLNTWDFQWDYAVLYHGGLAVVPTKNLVQNIGFGEDATHTFSNEQEELAEIYEVSFPIKFRDDCIRDFEYDKKIMQLSRCQLLKYHIRKFLPQSMLNVYNKLRRI